MKRICLLIAALLLVGGPCRADQTSKWLGHTAETSLAIGASINVDVDIHNLTELVVFVQFMGDSAKVSLSRSIDDGDTYTAFVTEEVVNGDSVTTAVQYAKSLSTLNAVGSLYSQSFIGRKLRVTIKDHDKWCALSHLWVRVVGR